MHLLLSGYLVVFVAIGCWSLLDDVRDRTAAAEIVAEAGALAVLAAGVVFRVQKIRLVHPLAWLTLVLVAVGVEVVVCRCSMRRVIEKDHASGMPESESRGDVLISELVTLLFFAPAIVSNFTLVLEGI
jgi:hypothetical protein